MTVDHTCLTWIDTQAQRMQQRVERWSRINSGSWHAAGVARVADAVAADFSALGVPVRKLAVPDAMRVDRSGRLTPHALGPALSLCVRPDQPRQVLLNIHLDTVYDPQHPFDRVWQEGQRLRGPGVADARGGLAVMLTALEAFERSAHREQLGYEVLLNPDEEVGSPGSIDLLREAATRHRIGLVFEPTLTDGSIVHERGGSGNFTLVVRGRAAHAGREYERGRSAIRALAAVIPPLEALAEQHEGVIINVGRIEGGEAVNMVPALAMAHFTVRYRHRTQEPLLLDAIDTLMADAKQTAGITCERHGSFTAPPKPLDDRTRLLLDAVLDCGKTLGLDLTTRATAGVCDGNRLADAGMAVIDTLGPRGGGLHSEDEYLILDSLTERAKLTALLLLRIASGQVELPPPTHAHQGADHA